MGPMSDLFAHIPKPSAKPGTGNAIFLADLANGASIDTLRKNTKAGRYPDLSTKIARDNLRFRGFTPSTQGEAE